MATLVRSHWRRFGPDPTRWTITAYAALTGRETIPLSERLNGREIYGDAILDRDPERWLLIEPPNKLPVGMTQDGLERVLRHRLADNRTVELSIYPEQRTWVLSEVDPDDETYPLFDPEIIE